MITSRYFWRRAFPSLLLVSSFVLLYQSTVSDSRYAARQAELMEGGLKPAPGTRLKFQATAYCKGQTTASGVGVRSGVAAADDTLLPVGSVVQADFDMPEYNGVYTIMDTGPEIQGRAIDVYMWSCFEALRFGRQNVHIVVLRLGWDPKDSTPLIETLFHRRTPGDIDEENRPSQPPRRMRPPQLPEHSVAPLPNPTFEKPSESDPPDGTPAVNIRP
jgi:3D (Asp-Asp-Asp) domain-containing protein